MTGTMVQAQEDHLDNREVLRLGVKFGVCRSNVYDSEGDEFNSEAKFGFTGGAFLKIPIGRLAGIQPEVLLTQKGFKGRGNLIGSPYDFKRTSVFLDIPIMLAVKPSEFISLMAGPQYSYLLNQKDEFTSTTTSYAQEQEFKNDNIRKNILGIVAGMDINLNQIIISGRYSWDIQNNKGDGTSSTPRYKNQCLQLTVGMVF